MNSDDIFEGLTPENPPMTCLGMDLDGIWNVPDHGVPTEALVIVRAFCDGHFVYYMEATTKMDPVLALGMANWAHTMLDRGIEYRTEDAEDKEETSE